MRTFPHTLRKTGFSLIEVTIAIGIVTMAVLPLLGTLGVGLNTIHDARKDMTEAQVITQIASTVLQAPFDTINPTGNGNGPFYFDQVGRQLSITAPNRSTLYSGTLVVTGSSNSSTDLYPGAPDTLLGSSAKKIQIIVSTVIPGTNRVITSSSASLIVPKS